MYLLTVFIFVFFCVYLIATLRIYVYIYFSDFSTYFADSIPESQCLYPKYILSSSCCSKDNDMDDIDVIEEYSVLNGDVYECLDDAQDTNSLWVNKSFIIFLKYLKELITFWLLQMCFNV